MRVTPKHNEDCCCLTFCSFQEEQLGTRTLTFINNQVYFSCRSHVYAEDIYESHVDEQDLVRMSDNATKRFIREDVSSALLYFLAVGAYTLRHLTYSSDILRAFTGVNSVLSQKLSTELFCGLPASIFDLALLWQPNGPLKRREGFPSWSWAGWVGPVSWSGDTLEAVSYGLFLTPDQEKKLVAGWLEKRTWIEWEYQAADRHRRSFFNKETPDHSDEGCKGQEHHTARTGNQYGGMQPLDTLIAHYKFQNPQHPRQSMADSLANLHPLRFYTLTAHFRIRPSTEYLRFGSVDKAWKPNGRIVFLLDNIHSQTSGYVLLDESWKTNCSRDQAQEFLMLSEANAYCNWTPPHDNHPYKTLEFYHSYREDDISQYAEFHVMMVVWKTIVVNGDEMRVAERAGLGRVLKPALSDSLKQGPVWKEVMLV